jgi:hypothetical protein
MYVNMCVYSSQHICDVSMWIISQVLSFILFSLIFYNLSVINRLVWQDPTAARAAAAAQGLFHDGVAVIQAQLKQRYTLSFYLSVHVVFFSHHLSGLVSRRFIDLFFICTRV